MEADVNLAAFGEGSWLNGNTLSSDPKGRKQLEKTRCWRSRVKSGCGILNLCCSGGKIKKHAVAAATARGQKQKTPFRGNSNQIMIR